MRLIVVEQSFSNSTVSLILQIPISHNAFADNPTPYGEWNLNLSFFDVTVNQNPSNL